MEMQKETNLSENQKKRYAIRCSDPNCRILAKHKPASDGKHYCKRHNPDNIEREKNEGDNMFFNKKPKQEDEQREINHKELTKHLENVHVDGVELPMKINETTEEEAYNEPPRKTKEPSTISLRLSLAELQVDRLAHAFIIEQTYAAYSSTGLPQHIVQAEAERVIAPHRKRLMEITQVLEQFDGTSR